VRAQLLQRSHHTSVDQRLCPFKPKPTPSSTVPLSFQAQPISFCSMIPSKSSSQESLLPCNPPPPLALPLKGSSAEPHGCAKITCFIITWERQNSEHWLTSEQMEELQRQLAAAKLEAESLRAKSAEGKAKAEVMFPFPPLPPFPSFYPPIPLQPHVCPAQTHTSNSTLTWCLPADSTPDATVLLSDRRSKESAQEKRVKQSKTICKNNKCKEL
jgi:hypothetical protein